MAFKSKLNTLSFRTITWLISVTRSQIHIRADYSRTDSMPACARWNGIVCWSCWWL